MSQAVQPWLESSRIGHCNTTRRCDSCETGASGVFPVPALVARTWSATALHCLQQCAGCAHCHYLSMGIAPFNECAWHSACKLSQLDQTYPYNAFQSAHVGASLKRRVAQHEAALAIRKSDRLRDVRRWVQAAESGFCAATEGNGDCITGTQGVLDVPFKAFGEGWLGAATACLASCAGCDRCEFISLSLQDMDCSWYSACPSRRQDIPGFRTGPALPLTARLARPAAGRASSPAAAARYGAPSSSSADYRSAQLSLVSEGRTGLILVTPTYKHDVQLQKLQHCVRRLRGAIKRGWVSSWIVVEDSNATSPAVAALLAGSGVPHVHTAVGPTASGGNTQRNRAYEIIRETRMEGVVYNMDDDNEYDPRLWGALLALEPGRVGVLAVQLSWAGDVGWTGNFNNDEHRVERPLYDRVTGVFGGFKSGWCNGEGWWSQVFGTRRFCTDMSAFAFDARLLHGVQGAPWNYSGATEHAMRMEGRPRKFPHWSGGGEDEFISKFIRFPEQLQPLANCGMDVLVSHNGFQINENRSWAGSVAARHPACSHDGWGQFDE